MEKQLHILHLEDNANDAEFLQAKLEEADIPCQIRVVQTRDEFVNALDTKEYDLIVSDFSLPSFDGRSALDIALSKCPDTPFIFVSGTIGEDAAIESLVRGATDYVLKGRNARLIPAVRRALQEAKAHKERMQADEALKQERILLRTVIDNLPDGIYTKDLLCRKTLANPVDVSNMGLRSEADALGKDDFAIFQKEVAEGFHADDLTVLQTGKPVTNREEYMIDAKGRKRWLLTSKIPLKDQKGQITGLVGIGHDITEDRRAEEALRESKEKYQNLFESNLAATFVSTPDGKVLECNPAYVRMFGFSSVDEAKGTDINLLYSDPQKRDRMIDTLRTQKQIEHLDIQMMTKNKSPLRVIANIVGKFDEHNVLTQMNCYLLDDTKQQLLEQQLIQAQKLESLGTLAGGIAHDFNNILGIIVGHATLVKRSGLDAEKQSQSIDAITTAAQRGAALVRQLLTFARKSDVIMHRIQLNDSVKEVASLIRETFPKIIDVAIELQENIPLILADSTQIHQVLLNLCVNARDAMPEGGKLTISTRIVEGNDLQSKFPKAVSSDYVLVEVADTGSGMTEETRLRIFEPFFTTKGEGKGTGLGLAVAFGIISLHHGFIDVSSSLGHGTTFSFYFPVNAEEIEPFQIKGEMLGETPGGTETILLVEDEEMLRELAKMTLKGKGYRVITAANGEEAIEIYKVRNKEIALVLSDMGLPKLDGYSAFKELKIINPAIKFIIASGYIDPGQKSDILRSGVREFIQKPYVPNDMLGKIRNVLDLT
ncbi:MAG: response regulator [Bacteroidota bacterium]